MLVIVATDGSVQSLDAARHLRSFADAGKVSEVVVIAVVSPRAAAPFANELGRPRSADGKPRPLSFADEAEAAAGIVAAAFDGWGPKIVTTVLSGSPANEIVKAADQLGADLVVMASGGRGLSDTILLGSTARRIQHSAPCPVLVWRSGPRREADDRQRRAARRE